eukprot:scaffold173869_cov51-Prasinocladus_malaysianus.AAC.1
MPNLYDAHPPSHTSSAVYYLFFMPNWKELNLPNGARDGAIISFLLRQGPMSPIIAGQSTGRMGKNVGHLLDA